MTAPGLTVESCQNHPSREGIGICVQCRQIYCSECITKLDGINHCRACLATLKGNQTPTRQPGSDTQEIHWGQRFSAYLVILFFTCMLAGLLFLFSLYPALIGRLGEL